LLRPQPVDSALVPRSSPVRAIALAVTACAASGCYRSSAFVAGPEPAEPHTVTGDLYLLGTVGEFQPDVRDYCGSRPAVEVETYGTVITGAWSVATLGIYTPRRVRIVCAKGELQ